MTKIVSPAILGAEGLPEVGLWSLPSEEQLYRSDDRFPRRHADLRRLMDVARRENAQSVTSWRLYFNRSARSSQRS